MRSRPEKSQRRRRALAKDGSAPRWFCGSVPVHARFRVRAGLQRSFPKIGGEDSCAFARRITIVLVGMGPSMAVGCTIHVAVECTRLQCSVSCVLQSGRCLIRIAGSLTEVLFGVWFMAAWQSSAARAELSSSCQCGVGGGCCFGNAQARLHLEPARRATASPKQPSAAWKGRCQFLANYSTSIVQRRRSKLASQSCVCALAVARSTVQSLSGRGKMMLFV